MKIMALFFPALIALKLNGKNDESKIISIVFEFCMYVLLINVSVMSVISYVLHIEDVTEVALQSFSFCVIYILMACVSATFWGIFSKVLKKNIESALSKGK